MKRSVLITGVAGSGKSTLCERLDKQGYEAYNIEDMEGLFGMYRKGTREPFENYEHTPENIKDADWICRTDKLKKLLQNQKSDLAFYCGVASNMDDIIPLFDKVIVLKTGEGELARRLSSREGTNDIGATKETRKMILGWKDWFENEMQKKGALVITADAAPEEVVKSILSLGLH